MEAGRSRTDRRFGQNFLHDRGVLARIVAAIAPGPEDWLVEIGPGEGALTEPLLASSARLDAIEIDSRLLPLLEQRFAGQSRLRIHHSDALTVDLGALRRDFGSGEAAAPLLRLVGNLPYNISSPLLFHVLEHAAHVRDMHFMLQKEVVQRLAASPGTKDYGRLTVAVAARASVQALFDVGPGAFRPPPRVTSSVVRITPLAAPPPPATLRQLDRLLRAAFAQRRKTLSNSLRAALGREGALASLRACGIDPASRAEALSPAVWLALAEASAPAAEH